MFKIIFFICFLISSSLNGQEQRTVLFTPEKNEKLIILNANESITTSVLLADTNKPTEKMIRIVGGIQMPQLSKDRGETNFRSWEYHIDDFLDSVNVENDKYALLFRGADENFPRTASRRIAGKDIGTGEIEVSFFVKRKNLKVISSKDLG